MQHLPLNMIAALSIACSFAACTSDEAVPDSGADSGQTIPDTGVPADTGVVDSGPIDTGMVIGPNHCDDLGLAKMQFQSADATFAFGDVAGDFTVQTTDGPWNLLDNWTGCDSYIFLNYISTSGTTEEELWDSTPERLVETPINAQYFFVSWESTEDARRIRIDRVRSRLEGAINRASNDEAVREAQRARFHYVVSSVFESGGSVQGFVDDYLAYQSSPAGIVDLGDRGQARAPLPYGFAIDRDQRWDSVGNLTRFVGGPAAFEMASFLPGFYDYKAAVRDELATESGVVTHVLLDDRVIERQFIVTATLAAGAELSAFDSLEFDVSVNCPHRNVFGCSEWDRNAYIYLCSDSTCDEKRELARWITPYWRRGHRRWIMDASPLMGLIAAGGLQYFQVVMGPVWERPTERDVRVALRLVDRNAPSRAVGAVRAFTGGQFNEDYNTRDPFEFTPPVSAESVELVVLVTGHGQATQTNCAEWCDHRHQFFVNGSTLAEIRHEGQVGSTAGCGPASTLGVPPGQWGNWAPERAYWCPGLPVPPRVIDITNEVTLGQPNLIDYSANVEGGPPGGGNISLSAYIVWRE